MSTRLAAVFNSIATEVQLVLEWWSHELQDAWHAALTHLVPRHADRVWIIIGDGTAQVSWRQNGQEHEGIPLPLEPTTPSQWDPLLSHLRETLSEVHPGTRTRVHLGLSGFLLRDITLPEVPQGDLPGMVALQVERLLPLPPGTMYVDWRIKQRLPERKRLVVTIAAAKRDSLDALREGITRTNLRVDEISAGGSPEKPAFNFSRLHVPLQTAGWDRRDRTLTISLASLLLVWLGLFVGRMVYERHRIEDIVASEHAQAQPARQLERQIRERAAPTERVQQLLLTPTATDLIATLSQAVPSDSWVYSAEISGGSTGATPIAKLTGFTPVAILLVDNLSKNPSLQAVKLIKATGIGVDRFEITTQLAQPGPSLRPRKHRATQGETP